MSSRNPSTALNSGRSFLESIESKPRTIVIETRLDIRTIASLLRYFNSKALFPNTRASLLRLIAEGYANLLTSNNFMEMITATDEALNYMKTQGLPIGEVGQRGNMSLARQLQAEDAQYEGALDDKPATVDQEIFHKALKELNKKDMPIAKRSLIPSNVKVVDDESNSEGKEKG